MLFLNELAQKCSVTPPSSTGILPASLAAPDARPGRAPVESPDDRSVYSRDAQRAQDLDCIRINPRKMLETEH
jgi:hypothetical protein